MREAAASAIRTLLAASPLAWLLPQLRQPVESSMSLHMLLQFPLLFAAGWAAAAWWPARASVRLTRIDAHGLTGALWASAVAAFWMIPTALDLALLDARVALLKYASWLLAGLWLAQGWRRLPAELAAFFLGSAAWMLITAGLLYRDAESRVCVSYRLDEQMVGGNGLIVWGIALGALGLLRLRAVLEPERGARTKG